MTMWRSGARALSSSIPWSTPSRQPNPLRTLAQALPPRLLPRFLSTSSSPAPDGVPSSSSTPPAYTGNLKKALAGLRRIDLDGLRWRVFDAKGQVLGRLASQIATVLQGKDKPTYAPHVEDGDMCVVVNAKDICVTGRKMTDKIYYWHTGYIGHLKERRLKDQMAKDPNEVIRKAVMRMLPRNRLRDKSLAGLRRIELDGLRWRVFDAKGQVIGRMASQIATVLQGKEGLIYTPHVENGDMCIVLNAKDISVTGRKMTDKFTTVSQVYWPFERKKVEGPDGKRSN